MIITIDGLDGAGKSTLAKSLSEKLGYEYIDKPIYELFNVKGDDNYLYDEIYHIQDLIYNKTDSNTLKSYFTGLSLLYIKECMSDKNLIIDSPNIKNRLNVIDTLRGKMKFTQKEFLYLQKRVSKFFDIRYKMYTIDLYKNLHAAAHLKKYC